MRPLILLLLGAISSFAAGPLSFGIKAGVPLTDFVDTARTGRFSYFTNTNRYIIGPSAELRLPFGLGVEFDALYRRVNYQGSGFAIDTTTDIRTTANAWEFPLLVKYRLPGFVIHPYVAAGVAWDNLSGVKQTLRNTLVGSGITTTTQRDPQELQNNTTTGFVLGGGVEVRALVVRLSPEIRYTRWGSKHFNDINGLLRSNQNQAEFLLGIHF